MIETMKPAAWAAIVAAAVAVPEIAAAEADPWLLEVFGNCWAAVESGTMTPLDAYTLEMKGEHDQTQYWYGSSDGPLGTVQFEIVVKGGTVNECYLREGRDEGRAVSFQDAEPTIAAFRATLSERKGFHEIAPGRRVVEMAHCPPDGPAMMAMASSSDHPAADDAEARKAGSTIPYPGNLELGVGRIPEAGIEVFCGSGARQ